MTWHNSEFVQSASIFIHLLPLQSRFLLEFLGREGIFSERADAAKFKKKIYH